VKNARVVEVRAVRIPANLDPAYTKPAQRERAEELLSAYPNTTVQETAEIVDFLARGMHLDVGLISARDEFKEKVEAIRAANPDAFRSSLLHLAMFVLIILAPLAFLTLLPSLLGRS
jgi:hypothetical protein